MSIEGAWWVLDRHEITQPIVQYWGSILWAYAVQLWRELHMLVHIINLPKLELTICPNLHKEVSPLCWPPSKARVDPFQWPWFTVVKRVWILLVPFLSLKSVPCLSWSHGATCGAALLLNNWGQDKHSWCMLWSFRDVYYTTPNSSRRGCSRIPSWGGVACGDMQLHALNLISCGLEVGNAKCQQQACVGMLCLLNVFSV